ncbi:MAG TPA: hypothetical protein VFZ93_00900 [Albitalea sp.]
MSGRKRITGDRQTAGEPPRAQRTTAHGGVQGAIGAGDEPDAKLPHERDQSPGNAADAPRSEGKKAFEDAKRGIPDTTKGAETDATYHKLRKG